MNKGNVDTFDLIKEDEIIVREYECTRRKRWFLDPILGFLTVTNKRVIYHSKGKSILGESILINDMPINDVVGIKVYQGLSINILLFVVFFGFINLGSKFVYEKLPSFLSSYWLPLVISSFFALIYVVLFKKIFNGEITNKISNFTEALSKIGINEEFLQAIFGLIMLILSTILIWRFSFTSKICERIPLLGWTIIIAYSWILFTNIFSQLRTFSLQIGSRSMKDTGIFIPGDSYRLFSLKDTTALQSIFAGPGKDVEILAREIGSLVFDIQHLGDVGVERWRKSE